MAIPAVAAPALLIFKRRRIGAVAVVCGVIAVAAGFVMPLAGLPDGTAPALQSTQITTPLTTLSIPSKGTLALLTSNSQSGLTILRHAFDHPLLASGSLGSIIVDSAMRGGIVLIVVAALLSIAFNVLPLMRGLVGVAAGVGLMGVAVEMGVVLGERMRIHSICAGSACSVDPHMGVWLMAIGFGVILVGGAVGALRPLAGMIGGVSFAIMGGILGAGVAFLVAQEHVLDVASQVTQVVH